MMKNWRKKAGVTLACASTSPRYRFDFEGGLLWIISNMRNCPTGMKTNG